MVYKGRAASLSDNTSCLDSDSVLTFGQRLEAEVSSADLALVSLGNLWTPGQETSSVDISEI